MVQKINEQIEALEERLKQPKPKHSASKRGGGRWSPGDHAGRHARCMSPQTTISISSQRK